jgi:hypothetical protein
LVGVILMLSIFVTVLGIIAYIYDLLLPILDS